MVGWWKYNALEGSAVISDALSGMQRWFEIIVKITRWQHVYYIHAQVRYFVGRGKAKNHVLNVSVFVLIEFIFMQSAQTDDGTAQQIILYTEPGAGCRFNENKSPKIYSVRIHSSQMRYVLIR